MTSDDNPNNPPVARPLTIREAAQRLGVSERTVYRRLRSGKLRPAALSDMSVSGVSVTVVTRRHDSSQNVSEERQQVSENDNMSGVNMTLEAMESMRAELREKDVQIGKLIESQRELNQTVQRLQEQMFEMARLVLTQNATKSVPPTPAVNAEEKENTVSGKGLFSRLFGVRDKESKGNP